MKNSVQSLTRETSEEGRVVVVGRGRKWRREGRGEMRGRWEMSAKERRMKVEGRLR